MPVVYSCTLKYKPPSDGIQRELNLPLSSHGPCYPVSFFLIYNSATSKIDLHPTGTEVPPTFFSLNLQVTFFPLSPVLFASSPFDGPKASIKRSSADPTKVVSSPYVSTLWDPSHVETLPFEILSIPVESSKDKPIQASITITVLHENYDLKPNEVPDFHEISQDVAVNILVNTLRVIAASQYWSPDAETRKAANPYFSASVSIAKAFPLTDTSHKLIASIKASKGSCKLMLTSLKQVSEKIFQLLWLVIEKGSFTAYPTLSIMGTECNVNEPFPVPR